MSETYTKLFTSITASTVWQEPAGTRLTWITMLAMATKDGCVYASVPGLARIANVSREEVDAALLCFLSPDPDSRTKDNEGRRIEEVEGGWKLINHAKFRSIRDAAERATYKRDWDRNNRPSGHARQHAGSPTSPTDPTGATPPAPAPAPAPQNEHESSNEDSSASIDSDAPRKQSDPIPYQAIADVFNATLTNLPKVRELSPARRTLIRSTWQGSKRRQSLAFWEAYFADCQADDFNNGTGPYQGTHETWRPTFDYLMKSKTVTRVYEAAMSSMEPEA